MKKITTLSVIVLMSLFCFQLNAQTDQGKVLLGVSSNLNLELGSDLMSLGFSSATDRSDADGYEEAEADKMTSFNLAPRVGSFVADNLVLGLDFNIAYASETNGENDYKESYTFLSVGPFVRYYIPSDKVLPFFEVSGSYGSITRKDEWNGDTEETKGRVMTFGGAVGLAAPLGERVTFDVLAGYNSRTSKQTEDNDDNFRRVIGTFGINLGFTILLGSQNK